MTIILIYLLLAIIVGLLSHSILGDLTAFDLKVYCEKLRISQGENPQLKLAVIYGVIWPILAVALVKVMWQDFK